MDIEKYASDPRTAFIVREYKRLKREAESLDSLSNDGSMDGLVREERENIHKQLIDLEKKIRSITESDPSSEKGANEIVLEVRAGAGGDEASIFARDLAVMYEKYSMRKGYSFSRVSVSENNIDGYKEASFRIQGKGAYDTFRFETGVHRIQRVPATEKSGRIHTSTASVAVLPIYKESAVTLDMNDIKVEFSRSGGAGGQNVNKVESAVRMVHTPTGLEVRCTEERTQLRNRERALAILTAKVEQQKRKEEADRYTAIRKSQIGSGDRSEKIRTYNVLQDRVTDHRIKKSWSSVGGIFAGDIDAIIASLQAAHQSEMDVNSDDQ